MATLISTQKPDSLEKFNPWFEQKFSMRISSYRNYYDNAIDDLRSQFIKTSFWRKMGECLPEIDDEFLMKKGVKLFSRAELPEVVTKSLKSLLNKAYRKDVLRNNQFPSEPKGGWISQNNWFEEIHDLVRTSFEVKYLDGVKFLLEKMKKVADETGTTFQYSFEARDEGYYAAHAIATVRLDILTQEWERSPIEMDVEIQVTTELQEMIKGLLHKYYEENRKKIVNSDYKWQWDYTCEQFVPNYMGHIAHYIEGMIVDIRDKQR